MTEPVTAITDYMLAAETLTLGALLLRAGSIQQQMWALSFLAAAVAAITGGTYHGFVDPVQRSGTSTLWRITVYSIALSTAFMFLGTIYSGVSRNYRAWLVAVAVIQFAVCVVLSHHGSYRYVVYNYAPLMLVVLIIQVFVRYTTHAPAADWMIIGLLVSFMGAGIQLSGFRSHQNWNHNDIYHIVQMGAMYLLYRGSLLLTDR